MELVFLNTCGFIASGRQEAFETVQKLLKKGKKVCLIGCALQYLKKYTTAEIQQWHPVLTHPNLSFLSRNDLTEVSLSQILKGFKSKVFMDFQRLHTPRAWTNLPQGFEYLKIAEGCDNACTFCIIPQIRGRQQSLPIQQILSETQNLVSQGAKEIILIAQDTTRYGTDLYGKPQLFELLEQMEQLSGSFRYRLLYLYPDLLSQQQLKKLIHFQKFIPYFDLPFQHISSPLLRAMGRYYDEKGIYQLLDFIKSQFPIHFIRTNFIIGFP